MSKSAGLVWSVHYLSSLFCSLIGKTVTSPNCCGFHPQRPFSTGAGSPSHLLHEFQLARAPGLVEPRLERAIHPQNDEPAFAGNRLNPIPFFAGRSLGCVSLSGTPSRRINVPRRVSKLSGVAIPSGTSVVIFIFGGCALLLVTRLTALSPVSRALMELVVFMVLLLRLLVD